MNGRGLSIYCPHCHRHTSLDPAPVKVKRDYEEWYVGAYWKADHQDTWWIGVCNGCQKPVLVLNHGATVYPNPLPSPSDSSIPQAIRDDLDEAKQCFSVSAWRGGGGLGQARHAVSCARQGGEEVPPRRADR